MPRAANLMRLLIVLALAEGFVVPSAIAQQEPPMQDVPAAPPKAGPPDDMKAKAQRAAGELKRLQEQPKAVQSCAPFKLPPELYSHWQHITWVFDPGRAK
jgi:hypothetical protein